MKKLINLSKEDQAHINNVLRFVNEKLPPKFARGVSEHGGGLWKKNVGPEIENELLDLIVYVYTYSDQVIRLVNAAKWIVQADIQGRSPSKAEIDALFDALVPFLQKPEK
jgi:hypothetical protein